MVWTRSVTQKQSSRMWFKWERRVMKPHVQYGLFVSHTPRSRKIVYEQVWKRYRFAGRCRNPHIAVASAQGLKQVEGFCIRSAACSHHAASGRLHYILSRKWIWWCLSVIMELDLTLWTPESALPPPQGLPRRHFESSWFNQYWLSTHCMPSTVPVRDKAQGTKYLGSSGHAWRVDHDGISGVGCLLGEYFSSGLDSAGLGNAEVGQDSRYFWQQSLQDLLMSWITGYEKGNSQSFCPQAPEGRSRYLFTELRKAETNKFGGEIMYLAWRRCSFRCLLDTRVEWVESAARCWLFSLELLREGGSEDLAPHGGGGGRRGIWIWSPAQQGEEAGTWIWHIGTLVRVGLGGQGPEYLIASEFKREWKMVEMGKEKRAIAGGK